MKFIFATLLLCAFGISGCVQKTYKRIVVCTLSVNQPVVVEQAGIRGSNQPLNWQEDYKMEVVKKDSLYKAVSIIHTGYTFTEIKFTVNNVYELEKEENRKIIFSKGDTTFYHAVYNRKNN